MTNLDTAAKSILVIEDDEATRVAMTSVLEDEGYVVRGAVDGQAALDYLAKAKPPSVILLDLMMPGMDGWQFRKAQLLDPALRSIPVVVVSADGNVAQKASALGANDHILKPIELEKLLQTVRRFC
jgi:CheY-like chemotaxis protein